MTAFRTINGAGDYGAYNVTGAPMDRLGAAHFGPGRSLLEPVNPRTVSNNVVGQGDPNLPNPQGLSDYMYAWGQFIDHDLDLEQQDGVHNISVTIPLGDPTFPSGAKVPLTRVVTDAHGFTINTITGWLDASMVYGSTQAMADALRLPDGHLKTSAGDNLPINPDGTFAAGDVRAQENPSLTALQTLFVREHNFQVDRLHGLHPNWNGERLYQEARAFVGGEIAHITYDEFLPHLLGKHFEPKKYHGFDPHVNPSISEEFAGAAYRWGHSTVSGDTGQIDNAGRVLSDYNLADVFFMPPSEFEANGGADGFLRHLASEPANAMDARIVTDLRNSLADPPDAIDLASTNIQRGHDLGLGTLNQTRQALGLKPYTDFSQITNDAGTVLALRETFASVNQVDLWTGGLAEQHAKGSFLGQTFSKIVGDQFAHLRDGDRLFYENALPAAELNQINGITLSQIITRDANTPVMQSDAFVAVPRTSLV